MRFTATIEQRPGQNRQGVWAGFVLPGEVVDELGTTAPDGRRRRRIPVAGTVNGAEYRSSVYLRKDRTWEFLTGLELRGRAGAGVGDAVVVEMAEDLDERLLEPPPDLAAALDAETGARETWDATPWSRKRELLWYLEDAKRPETRTKRVRRIVDAMREVPLEGGDAATGEREPATGA